MSELLTNRLREFALKVDERLDQIQAEVDAVKTAPKLHVGTTPPTDLTSVWIDTN